MFIDNIVANGRMNESVNIHNAYMDEWIKWTIKKFRNNRSV